MTGLCKWIASWIIWEVSGKDELICFDRLQAINKHLGVSPRTRRMQETLPVTALTFISAPQKTFPGRPFAYLYKNLWCNMCHERKKKQRNVSEFSCVPNYNTIRRQSIHVQTMGSRWYFPCLTSMCWEAVKQQSAAFSGESERNRDLRESSSVHAHSRQGPLQDHVTVYVRPQGKNELSPCYFDISATETSLCRWLDVSKQFFTLSAASVQSLQLIHMLTGIGLWYLLEAICRVITSPLSVLSDLQR